MTGLLSYLRLQQQQHQDDSVQGETQKDGPGCQTNSRFHGSAGIVQSNHVAVS